MVRLQIVLDPNEANVLAKWAASELRDPRDQIRLVLRKELERRGLIEPQRIGEVDKSTKQELSDDNK